MEESRSALSRRGVIAGMSAVVAGAAGAVLLPDRAQAATHPLVSRVPKLRNTSVTAPPITAEHSIRLSGADFHPGQGGDQFTRSGAALTAVEVAGQDFVASVRPNAGDVMTNIEVYVNPAGLGGDIALVRQEIDGTETPLATGTIPATTGFRTVTVPVPIGPFAEAATNDTAYYLVINVGQNAVLRGATITAFGQAGSLVMIAPQRVLDTRRPNDGAAKVPSGTIRTFTVDTIVPRIAVAALLNVTLDQTQGSGFLTVFAPDDVDNVVAPAVSNINWYTDNQIVANLAVSAMVGEADIYFATGGPGSTHVIVDVIGYFA